MKIDFRSVTAVDQNNLREILYDGIHSTRAHLLLVTINMKIVLDGR